MYIKSKGKIDEKHQLKVFEKRTMKRPENVAKTG